MPDQPLILSAALERLLDTVLERLIPTDDQPGARDVVGARGVIAALNTPRYAADAASIVPWLERLAAHTRGQSRSDAQWDDLLQRIEAGDEPTVPAAPFKRLITLTAELFYGSPPTQAPDRRTPAWDMLGYSPRPASPHG